jgi:DNA-binding transcriptional MocR family regulator
MLAFRIFEDSALKLRAVPEDDEGIDIDFLRREIHKRDDEAKAEGDIKSVSDVNNEHG